MKRTLLILCATLLSSAVLAENTTVCASSDIYYNSWTKNGGAAPRVGDLIATTNLTLKNQPAESVDHFFGMMPPAPKYTIAFDQTTTVALQSTGRPCSSKSIYQVQMSVGSVDPTFTPLIETVLCQDAVRCLP